MSEAEYRELRAQIDQMATGAANLIKLLDHMWFIDPPQCSLTTKTTFRDSGEEDSAG